MAAKISILDHNTFIVPNFTSDSISYTVDMNIGLSECQTGKTGDVCKHQYIIWASKLSESSHFLPYFDRIEKQKCAIIATGSSLPLDFYEGIHDRVLKSTPKTEISENSIDFDEIRSNSGKEITTKLCEKTSKLPIGYDSRRYIETLSADDCKAELRKSISILEHLVDNNSTDLNLLRGTMKFCERVQKYPPSRICTALHYFGDPQSSSMKITATTSLQKGKKGKIFVQPGSVRRRRHTDGSKKAVTKGMRVINNPFTKVASKKRPHQFSLNVVNKQAVCKKAGRSMASKTKHLSERQPKFDD